MRVLDSVRRGPRGGFGECRTGGVFRRRGGGGWDRRGGVESSGGRTSGVEARP